MKHAPTTKTSEFKHRTFTFYDFIYTLDLNFCIWTCRTIWKSYFSFSQGFFSPYMCICIFTWNFLTFYIDRLPLMCVKVWISSIRFTASITYSLLILMHVKRTECILITCSLNIMKTMKIKIWLQFPGPGTLCMLSFFNLGFLAKWQETFPPYSYLILSGLGLR